MKPDWQNKSFAKGGTATGPSTMHPKLKVGMSSLHSKIGMANSNIPQAPKPAVRKFADGGMVRTRSDDEIGDTDIRTGRVDPGSYERRMKAGEENMERLRSAADTIKSFFSKDKGADTSASNATGDSGMSASDTAKKQAMSGGFQMAKADSEEPRRQISDYMVKKEATEDKTESVAAPVEAEPFKAKEVAKQADKPAMQVKKSTANRLAPIGNSQKDVDFMAQQKNRQRQSDRDSTTDTGDETARLRDRTSKFVPGFGQVDNQGNIIPGVRGGLKSSQVYGGDGSTIMSRAEKRYLQSRIDAGNMTAMEKAQAKRAGLL